MSGEEPDLKLVEQVRRRLAGLARDWTPMDVAHAILDCGRVASDKTVLAVVEELEAVPHGVVADAEGIYRGVTRLDIVAQQVREAVLVDAGPV